MLFMQKYSHWKTKKECDWQEFKTEMETLSAVICCLIYVADLLSCLIEPF